jgi:16S rRNA (cytidine1402-2'-O)-methyltransferase
MIKNSTQGKVVLIPVTIGASLENSIPNGNYEYCKSIFHFYVENTREARRFLKLVDISIDIDKIEFIEINKNADVELQSLSNWLKNGLTVGVISDSGCPGIADPGSIVVAKAHELGAQIIPLVGPNSIILALMASGFNGQNFAFNGYLPVKDPVRSASIKHFETLIQKSQQTQIFIETPYRNNQILSDFIKNCQPKTQLCIALGLTTSTEMIKKQSISEWSKKPIDLPKEPAIFLLGS